MNNYPIQSNLDIVKKELNGVIPYGIFQGTKNIDLQLRITKNAEELSEFVPTSVTPYLVVYDRLDSLSTAYQLRDNIGVTIDTRAGVVLIINTNEMPEIVKYPNRCGLIFNMRDDYGNSIITTEFEYNVIPNNAYDFIYGLN